MHTVCVELYHFFKETISYIHYIHVYTALAKINQSISQPIKERSQGGPTSGVVEGGSGGFAPFPAVALVEGEALVAGARHHLHIPDGVSRLTQGLQPVHFPAAGVRQVESLVHGVHCQVVLVSRTRAGEKNKDTVL